MHPPPDRGIDAVNVFLDDRDQGGKFLGSGTLGQRNPMVAAGSQFATAGLVLRASIPSGKNQHDLVVYAHSSVSDTETILRVPVKTGI